MWPINLLIRQQGRIVCPYDVDDLSILYRPQVIAEVLADPSEGKSDKPEAFRDPGEIRFS